MRSTALPWLVLALGALGSLVAAQYWRSLKEGETRTRFHVVVADANTRLEGELHRYEDALKSTRGLFAASEQVERDEFSEFVRSLSLPRRYPGARGLVLVSRVPPQRRRPSERPTGAARFRIEPASRSGESFLTTYVEPSHLREASPGADLTAVAGTRAALQQARDSGRPVLTAGLAPGSAPDRGGATLDRSQNGKRFMLYVPVYRKRASLATVAERHRALLGWLGASLDGEDFILGALRQAGRDVAIEAFDARGTSRTSLIAATTGAAPAAPRLATTGTLNAYGRPWTLRVSALPGFVAPFDRREPLLVLAGGLLLSVALFAFVWVLSKSKVRALRLVDAATAELAHQALHDPLTGLPNRVLFLDRLELALAQSKRGRHGPAVMFFDLDRFKVINDSLGHDRGDELLLALAARLQASIRPGDTVARLGGDEFTFLCNEIADERQVVAIAERIARAVEAPFARDGGQLVVTASIGIAIATDPDQPASDLLRDADAAMYRAKEHGKARYELFDDGMRARAVERLRVENDLRLALERGELRTHYQPTILLDSGQIVGVEALVRWEHPERGLIAPDEFIPLAEETGLIVPLGAWVLQEACQQLSRWRARLPGLPLPVMAVNLSARQLAHPNLPDVVAAALADADLEPAALSLEITESVLMADAEAAIVILQRLKELGVGLSVDDFGTGYSSLSYLKRFPVDVLKVDRSFIKDLGRETQDGALVAGIVSMAHALGVSVVAEGVETAEQLTDVRALGCDVAQGFYFARPQSSDTLVHLLAGDVPWSNDEPPITAQQPSQPRPEPEPGKPHRHDQWWPRTSSLPRPI